MHITNNAGLPDAIVQAIASDPYDPGDCDITVTRLIAPPQQAALIRAHAHEIEEDAADRIWALVGQIGHGILERANIRDLSEVRLHTEVCGWRVGGRFDNYALLPDATLQDYKFTSVWAVIDGVKPEWIQQLNVLAWLLGQNGYPAPQRLQIVAILRDWSKGKAKAGGDYPAQQVRVLPVPLWSLRDQEQYICGRVLAHANARAALAVGAKLPNCTPDERWARPTAYAVRKPGRKTALRVLHTEADARALVAQTPGGYIETRPGESIRCADYCAAAPWCEQRRAELSAAAIDDAA